LSSKTIAVWGLAFKPETDDMREAPALVIIDLLLANNCKVKVYDPIAMNEGKRILGDKVTFCKDLYDCALDSDAALLLTEWKEFRMPSWNVLKRTMHNALIIDGRNIYDKKELAEYGFEYEGIGIN
jgi:UDPglucose 6-dehydrogenase